MRSSSFMARRSMLASLLSVPLAAHASLAGSAEGTGAPHVTESETATRYRSVRVDGVNIFYREAGPADAPVLLLLHGYPSSSRMFEPLFPLLRDRYRLIAPDYPGFGLSEAPDRSAYSYTFEGLARTMQAFTEILGLKAFNLYVQDYGGPIGFHLATMRPERILSLTVQNAVVHEEGLTEAWNLRRSYWQDRQGYEQKIREGMYSVPSGIARHRGSRASTELYNPDLWMDEIAFLRRPGSEAIQLDLAFDYQSNVRAYPQWQAYLRQHRPRVLVVWGKHDPIFSVHGAMAIARELPSSTVNILNAGHFALDDAVEEIAQALRALLG